MQTKTSNTCHTIETSEATLPRGILLLLSLHHVTEAGISQSLGEVCVGSHEAVVVEARAQAGRAEAQSFALGAAGSTQHTVILGSQVGPKQRLQQLQSKSKTFQSTNKLKNCNITKI